MDRRYQEWLAEVPESIKQDPIWKFEAYQKALLLSDLAWEDCGKLLKEPRGREIARQLIRSAGSVSANVDEGFGRGIDRGEYTQYLRYALGSARETRSWYYKARALLSDEVTEHRMRICSQIIGLLVTTINKQRQRQ